MNNEKIIRLINREIDFSKNLKSTGRNCDLYSCGYEDGLEMALKIIRDCDSEAIEEMAKYYTAGK